MDSSYTKEAIQKMMIKARNSIDSIEFSAETICANGNCPRKTECFRYEIYDQLLKNKIHGHTATVFESNNCKYFIQLHDY